MIEKLFNFCCQSCQGLQAVTGHAVSNTGNQLRLQTLRAVLLVIKGTGVRLRQSVGRTETMGALALHIGKCKFDAAARKGTTNRRHCKEFRRDTNCLRVECIFQFFATKLKHAGLGLFEMHTTWKSKFKPLRAPNIWLILKIQLLLGILKHIFL